MRIEASAQYEVTGKPSTRKACGLRICNPVERSVAGMLGESGDAGQVLLAIKPINYALLRLLLQLLYKIYQHYLPTSQPSKLWHGYHHIPYGYGFPCAVLKKSIQGVLMIRSLFFTLLLSVSAVYAEADISKVKVGDKISGPLTIGKNVFPLPTGEWEVANLAINDLVICQGDCTSGFKQEFDSMQTVQLFKSMRGKLLEAMLIETPVNNSAFTIGKNSSKNCDSKTGYFYTDFNSGYDLPECLRTHHVVNYYETGNLNKFHSTSKLYLDKNNIEIPRTVIQSIYYYASKHGATTVRFAFNQEQAGFPPSTVKNWDANEWHKDNMNAEQKQFSSHVVEWSKKMAASMQKAIKNKEVTEISDFMESVPTTKQ